MIICYHKNFGSLTKDVHEASARSDLLLLFPSAIEGFEKQLNPLKL